MVTIEMSDLVTVMLGCAFCVCVYTPGKQNPWVCVILSQRHQVEKVSNVEEKIVWDVRIEAVAKDYC